MRHLCLLSVVCAFSVEAAARAETCPDVPPIAGTKLTFNDEFKTSTLDTTKWTAVARGGAKTINQEQQAYVPGGVTMVPGGGARLQANNTPFLTQGYTSGEIVTRGHFAQTYGYFEIKAKFPNGRGLWPAFWMLPSNGDWPPEITPLEYIYDAWDKPMDSNPSYYSRGLGWPFGATQWKPADGSPHSSNSGVYLTDNYKNMAASPPVYGDWGTGWHTYGVAWYPKMMAFYADGKQNFCWVEGPDTKGSVPHQPMYMLANLAISAKGGWPGTVDDTTPLPANMDIAWVRAYQFPNMPATAPDAVSIMNPAVSSAIAHPGDTVTISADIVTGDNVLARPASASFTIFNYDATQEIETLGSLGPTSYGANTTSHLKAEYTLPAALRPGVYTIYTCVSWKGGKPNEQCLPPDSAPAITVVAETK